MNATYDRYSSVVIGGQIYGSFRGRHKNSSIVMAMYNEELRPARIHFFAKVTASVNGAPITKIVAYLEWYQRNPKKDLVGKPVTIWEQDLFESGTFIPAKEIVCKTISLVDEIDSYGKVLFVSPYQ